MLPGSNRPSLVASGLTRQQLIVVKLELASFSHGMSLPVFPFYPDGLFVKPQCYSRSPFTLPFRLSSFAFFSIWLDSRDDRSIRRLDDKSGPNQNQPRRLEPPLRQHPSLEASRVKMISRCERVVHGGHNSSSLNSIPGSGTLAEKHWQAISSHRINVNVYTIPGNDGLRLS